MRQSDCEKLLNLIDDYILLEETALQHLIQIDPKELENDEPREDKEDE